MPIDYWDHSFNTFVYLINRLLTKGLSTFTSSFFSLYNMQPNYLLLRVFGSSYFPLLRPYNQHKLQFGSSQCVHLGISPTHKGHKCLNAYERIYISKDVKFNEDDFPFNKIFKSLSDESTCNSHDHTYVPFDLPSSNHIMQTSVYDEQSPFILSLAQTTNLTEPLNASNSPNIEHNPVHHFMLNPYM